ncbi:MAG TPA: hypothetical protein VHZ51_03090 [Ktedonobacteraceae bacterium]|jgi:hypothetical protein|nr:hypothetical protein [Ktedonobacteraceae bacterium]
MRPPKQTPQHPLREPFSQETLNDPQAEMGPTDGRGTFQGPAAGSRETDAIRFQQRHGLRLIKRGFFFNLKVCAMMCHLKHDAVCL